MDKKQEKFFKLLKLLDDCRQKLYATYNLFVSCLAQSKQQRGELGAMYEQLLAYNDELALLEKSGKKVSKVKLNKYATEVEALTTAYAEQVKHINSIMDDCERCRKTYKGEIALCCKTYKMLKPDDVSSSIQKGYRQQVKLSKAILSKTDEVKASYKKVKEDVKAEQILFNKLASNITEKISKLG